MKGVAKMTIKSSLTVLFDNPFWIGLYERIDNGKYEVCKITFGAEPKDYEIYRFFSCHFMQLKFSPPVKAEKICEKHINPKRMQREIQRQLEPKGVGTKAQQALKQQHELLKTERKTTSRAEREAEKERLFALKQQKKKAKHRGR